MHASVLVHRILGPQDPSPKALQTRCNDGLVATRAGEFGSPPVEHAIRVEAGAAALSDDLARTLCTALARPDLPPNLRNFLRDVERQARRRPLTVRQMEAVQRIAQAQPPPDFAAINRGARSRAEDVCRRLLPGGARHGKDWAAGDLSGAAGKSLRVRLEGERAGAWIDNATCDKGGDFVSLAAAVARIPQADAARQLARMLGMEAGR